MTQAGSLRRGRETVGDLDILVACPEDIVAAAVEHTAAWPLATVLLAKGQNKVSFRMRNGLQVDVRLLPEGSYGAALQYFTGSKMHNVTLRQRALRQGFTRSASTRWPGSRTAALSPARPKKRSTTRSASTGSRPELRENNGEIEAAAAHTLPHAH